MTTASIKPVPVLGIDFGTTTSTACLRVDGKFEFIKPEGDAKDSLMPSIVYFTNEVTENGEQKCVIGLPATIHLTSTKERLNVVQHVKRSMPWDAEWDNLSDDERTRFNFYSRSYRPAEIAGKIIEHLKLAAERQIANNPKLSSYFDFHGTINSAVLTVPAQFGSKERASVLLAAKRYAGFHEVHLLEEPVSAALGLELHKRSGRKLVMIVDLGGGTLDVTLLCVGKNAPGDGFLELGRIGDNELGGTDWDNTIAQHVVATYFAQPRVRDKVIAEVRRQLEAEGRTPPAANSIAFEAEIDQLMRRTADISRNATLQAKCEEAKILFGAAHPKLRADILVNAVNAMFGKIEGNVTHEWFNQNTQLLSDWCAKRCEQLLEYVSVKQLRKVGLKRLTWKQIDQIVLVGGGSKLPAVQAAIASRSGKKLDPKHQELYLAERPQHVVAMGAAVYAEMRQQNKVLEGIGIPRSPRTFGIINQIPRNHQNGNGSLLTRLWALPGSLLGRNNNHDDADLREAFSPIIQISEAADEAITRHYQLVNKDSRKFHARIIEQRFTRHHQDGQLYHIWDLRIDKLPGPDPRFPDEVTITMMYGNDHQLSAVAECRGEIVDAILTEKSIQDRGTPIELNAK